MQLEVKQAKHAEDSYKLARRMTKRRIALAGIRFVDIDESLFARSVIFFHRDRDQSAISQFDYASLGHKSIRKSLRSPIKKCVKTINTKTSLSLFCIGCFDRVSDEYELSVGDGARVGVGAGALSSEGHVCVCLCACVCVGVGVSE